MKVAILTEYANPSSNSTGYYWNEISDGISRDHEVITVCTDFEHIDDSLLFKNLSRGLWKRSKFIFFISSLFHILKIKKRTDLFIISSNPFFLPLLIFFLHGKRNIIVTFDKFPENISIRSIPLKLLSLILSPLFKYARRMADVNVLVGHDMIDSTYNNPHVVQNWATCSVNFENNSSLPHPNLLYFGNLGIFQAIPLLIDQIKNISSDCIYDFGFFGSGVYHDDVKSLSLQFDKVFFGDAVPMDKASYIYADYSISIVTLLPEMGGKCVPSKVYNALANGHPILAFVGGESEVALLIRRYNCGWVLDITNVTSLNDFLLNFTISDFNEKKQGVKSIPLEELSGEMAIKNYLKIIDSNFSEPSR